MDANVDTTAYTIESSMDGIDKSGRLQLWAWCPQRPEEVVQVELFANQSLLGRFSAEQYRDDLLRAGKGDGRKGLMLDIAPILAQFANEPVLEIVAVACNPVRARIGSRRIGGELPDWQDIPRDHLKTIEAAFRFPLSLAQLRMNAQPAEQRAAAERPAFEAMFERASPVDPALAVQISAYADYVRCRYRVDTTFPVELGLAETTSYLKWYIESYSALRNEKRAPLAPYEIAYLNELVHIGGQRYHLSRATMMFMYDNPSLLAGLDLKSTESYLAIVYWWSVERARSMYVEDCLIPPSYKNLLGSVRPDWSDKPFPLTRFMEVYFSRDSRWHFLDLSSAIDRLTYYLVVMLLAVTTPWVLEFLPRAWLSKLTLAEADGVSIVQKVGQSIMAENSPLLRNHSYAEVLRSQGFDVEKGRSLALTRSQGRVFSAALPRPAAHPDPRHIQVIGPMRKASGLGQAARLSASVLDAMGCSYSCYDFDLDNPAPVGFANEVVLSPLVCPAVNLIHLNAESIPLVYAYMPDVFTGAYNIGYFFWELDSPARCHALALELLDEVWVSSEYGVEIYRPHSKKPVVNVGMAYEVTKPVAFEDARYFLETRMGVSRDEFVFMAAFDSFSFIQRKNPHGIVRSFKAAFCNGEKVRLLLKTHNKDLVGDPIQQRIWQSLENEIGEDERIVLVNETLSYDELIQLKCSCDCYVSLHKSEGWGFGMVEAMNLGIPVIATGYSGNMEFCNDKTCWLVDYELKALDRDDYIFVVPGQRWAEPSIASAAAQMRAVFSDPAARASRVAAARAYVGGQFSPDAIAKRYSARLQQIVEESSARTPSAPPMPSALKPKGKRRLIQNT